MKSLNFVHTKIMQYYRKQYALAKTEGNKLLIKHTAIFHTHAHLYLPHLIQIWK